MQTDEGVARTRTLASEQAEQWIANLTLDQIRRLDEQAMQNAARRICRGFLNLTDRRQDFITYFVAQFVESVVFERQEQMALARLRQRHDERV